MKTLAGSFDLPSTPAKGINFQDYLHRKSVKTMSLEGTCKSCTTSSPITDLTKCT